MKNITVIGIDIAKNVMQLHGTDERGTVLLKKRLPREKFLSFMANTQRCLIGMEACGSAHYWADELMKLGYTLKLMAPEKVKKYASHQKNDALDAKACAEAALRKDIRGVGVRTKQQLEIQALHRIRSQLIKQQTGTLNMVRGILLEFGIAIKKSKSAVMKKLCVLLEPENEEIGVLLKNELSRVYAHLKHCNEAINGVTEKLETLANEQAPCRKIMTVPGIGEITATAVIAKIGNGSEFQKGRELSAYLGIVPRQSSSGQSIRLGSISKHGDRYIRQLLIHGGRSAAMAAIRKNKITNVFMKQDVHSVWIRQLIERVGMNKASVAIANKNARMIVALLKKDTTYQAQRAH